MKKLSSQLLPGWFKQISTPVSYVQGGTFGFGKNKNAKLQSVTKMTPIKKGKLLQIGCLNGFEVLNAITVTTYWNDDTMKSTVSSYEFVLPDVKLSLPVTAGAV